MKRPDFCLTSQQPKQQPLQTNMKSAYELAMERLNKTAPMIKLSKAQKTQLAELDSKYQAKIAEREIALNAGIIKAGQAGDFEGAEKLQQELVNERRSLQAELEQKKEAVRQQGRRT